MAKARKKAAPILVYEDGYYWIYDGKKKVNVGRNKRYAEAELAKRNG